MLNHSISLSFTSVEHKRTVTVAASEEIPFEWEALDRLDPDLSGPSPALGTRTRAMQKVLEAMDFPIVFDVRIETAENKPGEPASRLRLDSATQGSSPIPHHKSRLRECPMLLL
jgi:hypothetical protein